MSTPSDVIESSRGFFDLALRAVCNTGIVHFWFGARESALQTNRNRCGWAILQPLTTMVIFTVFWHFAAPYGWSALSCLCIHCLAALMYFAQAIERSGKSLVGDTNLIKKLAFPICSLSEYRCGFLDGTP